MNPPPRLEAVGYIRVSTEEQAREGVSLDAQKAKIEAWSQVNETTLIGFFEDAGISGARSENREGLQKALEMACDKKAVLVVYSLSRLSRSTKDTLALAERLEKAGADLVSLSERIDTTSAAGKMVFRMLAVLNEFERDQISERTTAALRHKREQHQAYSPTPYGFDRFGDILVINYDEQKIIEEILELREKGWSLRRIADHLNTKGIPSKSGRRWLHSAVASVTRANSVG
ncbi:MAG TPA: recombinase family protein [Candidatus Fermentibacter daniensis]|nr:recombinase family protein [Candidatus Fermentibacter daniensis]HOR07483.1 recombinase family protein [Candidatus Fermentibacter daniensis]HPK52750.1 recombinase family protein [Candidatus Fermentibacter daniensis]